MGLLFMIAGVSLGVYMFKRGYKLGYDQGAIDGFSVNNKLNRN